MDDLKASLLAIFPSVETFTVIRSDKNIHIKIGKMYEAPGITFHNQMALYKLFGSDQIHIDGYSVNGCETCDHGSDYGHDIAIIDVIQNIEYLPNHKMINING